MVIHSYRINHLIYVKSFLSLNLLDLGLCPLIAGLILQPFQVCPQFGKLVYQRPFLFACAESTDLLLCEKQRKAQ